MTTIDVFLIVLCLILATFLCVFLYLWYQERLAIRQLMMQNRQLEQDNQRLRGDVKLLTDELRKANRIVKAIQAGSEEFVLLGTLIGLGNSPVDLLSEAQRILYYLGKATSRQTEEDMQNLLVTLLRDVSARINLQPIAPYHQIVQFDPLLHQGDHPILEGAQVQVQVLETGWRVDGLVVKKAYVTGRVEK
jgi:hypothetical protein